VSGRFSIADRYSTVLTEAQAAAQKSEELDQLLASTIPDFLHIQKVAADGNCFFRAVSRSYKDITVKFLHHSTLRQTCVHHIINNQHLRSRFFDDTDFRSYTESMLRDGTFADELCIRSLSSLLNLQILVYTPSHGLVTFGDPPEQNSNPIRITHNGVNHFDCVLFRRSPITINNQYFSFRASETLQQPAAITKEAIAAPSLLRSEHSLSPQNFERSPKDVHKVDSSSWNQDPRKDLTILSADVTSWTPHAAFFLEYGADVLVVQETRLSSSGIQTQTNSLSKRDVPWSCIWGKPPGQIKIKQGFAKRATGKSSHGGVGILAKTPLPLIRTGLDSTPSRILHESSRWCTAAIPVGPVGAMSRRFIHLISFYGIANRGNGARHSQNELLMTSLFEHASSLGNQPVVICMDANTTVDKSITLQRVLATSEWHDVAVSFSDGSPAKTFCASSTWNKIDEGAGVTRPDHIIANAPALAMITSFSVLRNLPIKGHLGLQLTLKRELCMLQHRILVPPTIFAPDNFEPLSKEEKQELFSQVFAPVQADFHSALKTNQTNRAWSLLAKAGEKFLQASSKTELTYQFGRGKPPTLKSINVASHAISKQFVDVPQRNKLIKWMRSLRQIDELKHKQVRHISQKCSQQDLQEAPILFESLTRAASGFNLHLGTSWHACILDPFAQRLQHAIQSLSKDARLQRIQAWKCKLRQSFDIHKHGDAAFAWLRSKPNKPIMALKDRHGQVVTDPSAILEAVEHAWQDLFNNNKLISWEAFPTETQSCIPEVTCNIPQITGEQLHRKILTAKDSRAIALDGWRIPELKALPCHFFDLVATVFHAIEKGADWPEACLQGTVSTIPKDSEQDPASVPPGDLIASVGLATRPITNLSPLYSVYSSVRFEQMSDWREGWLPKCARGARKNNEVHDISWNLALAVEHAVAANVPLGGISIDKKKIFDLLQHDLGHSLMKKLGAPVDYIAAQEQFYKRLRYRYKINKSFGGEHTRTNGFAQGDTYSLQIALANMAVWTRYIQKHSQDITTGSFIDDSHFYHVHSSPEVVSSRIATAWNVSRRFDDISGLETNEDKTFIFGTTQSLEDAINREISEVHQLPVLTCQQSFRLVGSVITTRGVPQLTTRSSRICNVLQKLHRIRSAPLRFSHKVRLAESVFAGAIFGSEIQECTLAQHNSLRSSVVALLWNGNTWCRSFAITFTHIVPAFRLLLQPASIYHCLNLARRLLIRRPDLHDLFRLTWNITDLKFGPVARIRSVVESLEADWSEPFLIRTSSSSELNLLSSNKGEFQHTLREAIRQMVIQTDSPIHTRKDYQGGPPFAYKTNTRLLLNLFERATLRNILTGTSRTAERLFKAGMVTSPQCEWCQQQEIEDHDHFFWKCPAWTQHRSEFLSGEIEFFHCHPAPGIAHFCLPVLSAMRFSVL